MDNRYRLYRLDAEAKGLVSFVVRAGESDLLIWAERDLREMAMRELLRLRGQLEEFITRHPRFKDSLVPYDVPEGSPPVVRAMAEAARDFGVGPMAGVAGAVADLVGSALGGASREVLVENGGDLYISSERERVVGVFTGDSPFRGRLALRVPPCPDGLGICTSSASVGPSLSLGKADAALVLAESAVAADAAASLLGNLARGEEDIPKALEEVLSRPRVRGGLLVMGDRLGVLGDLELLRS